MASALAIFRFTTQAAPAIPLVLGLARFRKLSGRQKWFMGLLGISLLLQGIAAWYIYVLEIYNTNFWYHWYVLLEFSGITLVYRKELGKLLPVRVFDALMLGFTALFFANVAWIAGWDYSPAVPRTVESVLVLCFVFGYFGTLFKEMKVQYVERQFLFWVSAGNLVFFSANLLLFIFTDYLNTLEATTAYNSYNLQAGLALLLALLYAPGMLMEDRV